MVGRILFLLALAGALVVGIAIGLPGDQPLVAGVGGALMGAFGTPLFMELDL